jgi:hypothetical protein
MRKGYSSHGFPTPECVKLVLLQGSLKSSCDGSPVSVAGMRVAVLMAVAAPCLAPAQRWMCSGVAWPALGSTQHAPLSQLSELRTPFQHVRALCSTSACV